MNINRSFQKLGATLDGEVSRKTSDSISLKFFNARGFGFWNEPFDVIKEIREELKTKTRRHGPEY